MRSEGAADGEPGQTKTIPRSGLEGQQENMETRAATSAPARFPLWPFIGTVATAAVPLALLYFVTTNLAGRTVDLITFLLALLAATSITALIWRLHALYLLLDQQWRQGRLAPDRTHSDPLTRLAALALWRDGHVLRLLTIAVVANLAVFGYVSAKYASLPPFLPLHYSATGDVDRLGTPPEVFMMPMIGVVVLVTNLVLSALLYRHERLASYLLIGSSIFVQLLLFVATASIVSRA